MAALFDEHVRQNVECGKPLVRWHALFTDCSNLHGIDALLECKCRVKDDCIRAGVRDCVRQQNDLNLLLVEAAAVDLLKYAIETVDEFARTPAILGSTLNAASSCWRAGFEVSWAEVIV